jgi:hypothetical protein
MGLIGNGSDLIVSMHNFEIVQKAKASVQEKYNVHDKLTIFLVV